MTDIALVLFDLNGVLYRYDRPARIAALAATTGQTPAAIQAAIWDSGFEDEGDSGTLDADAYLRGFAARISHPLTERDWIAALHASIAPIPENLALLRYLRMPTAVLTNNNLLVKRHFATLYPDIAGHTNFVSAEFDARKPDPDVYRACTARLGVAPDATLFIDDSLPNVEGARAAGLRACHYKTSDTLAAALLPVTRSG